MATQQYGYGPNVWGTAKGTGVQQFAKLAQPGAVAPQFKENKYKAMAAKAIGEMAYGAIMNQDAKKKEKIAAQRRDVEASKQFDYDRFNPKVDPTGVSPGTGDRGIDLDGFDQSIVPTTTESTATTGFDTTSPAGEPFKELGKDGVLGTWTYMPETKPIGMKAPMWQNKIDSGYKPGGEWKWKPDQYTGNAADYKAGDRVQVGNMLYQVVEGRNGIMTITPIY